MKRFLVYVTFLFLCVFSGHLLISTTEARKAKENKKSNAVVVPSSSGSSGNSAGSTIFNVMTYGAKGDGTIDDTKAFLTTWEAACAAAGYSEMLVPRGTYSVNYVTFSGKGCKSSKMVFQLDGGIIASTKTGSLQWLEFTNTDGLIIQGTGNVDGNGKQWWDGKMASTRPAAIRVADSTNVLVTGLTIQNSQKAHLKFDNCVGVEVNQISISSPGTSPNTDGIHLQNSKNVKLLDSKIACGDDCVSIQTGCSGITIDKVTCGPSHGISIGSLGEDKSKACVSNVTVTGCTITDSDSGVRIKTWQGGQGSVTGVSFQNIKVTNVKKAIVIDQKYCDGGSCAAVPGNVAISGITYADIQGSVTVSPMSFVCGSAIPCTGIALSGISLTGGSSPSNCENAFGEGDAACLQKGGGSSYKHSSYNSDTC